MRGLPRHNGGHRFGRLLSRRRRLIVAGPFWPLGERSSRFCVAPGAAVGQGQGRDAPSSTASFAIAADVVLAVHGRAGDEPSSLALWPSCATVRPWRGCSSIDGTAFAKKVQGDSATTGLDGSVRAERRRRERRPFRYVRAGATSSHSEKHP